MTDHAYYLDDLRPIGSMVASAGPAPAAACRATYRAPEQRRREERARRKLEGKIR